MELFAGHDAQGKASWSFDLRNLPANFVGVHFAVQALAVDANLAAVLSSPVLPVIGH